MQVVLGLGRSARRRARREPSRRARRRAIRRRVGPLPRRAVSRRATPEHRPSRPCNERVGLDHLEHGRPTPSTCGRVCATAVLRPSLSATPGRPRPGPGCSRCARRTRVERVRGSPGIRRASSRVLVRRESPPSCGRSRAATSPGPAPSCRRRRGHSGWSSSTSARLRSPRRADGAHRVADCAQCRKCSTATAWLRLLERTRASSRNPSHDRYCAYAVLHGEDGAVGARGTRLGDSFVVDGPRPAEVVLEARRTTQTRRAPTTRPVSSPRLR